MRKVRHSRRCRSVFELLEKRQLLSTSTSGAVDPAFGQHGVGDVSIPGASYVNVSDVAIQADGKIVIVGSALITDPGSTIGMNYPLAYGSGNALIHAPPVTVSQQVLVARLNADGTPDESFNGTGFVLTDFSAPDAEAMRVKLDGNQILVAGDASGNFALARYNGNGSLDTKFGTGGRVSLDLGSDTDKAWGLTVEGDGKIVADGQSGGQAALVRFNADGSLDTTFGHAGQTLTPAPGATAVSAADGTGPTLDGSGGVKILNDGNILVVSNETETDSTGRVDFLYYDAAGKLARLDAGAAQSSPPSVVDFTVLRSGKVITFSSDGSALVQRYNADATLDTSFGDHGTAAATLNWGAYGTVQSDGKILVAGSGSSSSGDSSGLGVARYNADGSIDSSFGEGGQVVRRGAGYAGAAVAVDSLGRIVAVGSSYDSGAPIVSAARFLPDVGVVTPTARLVSAPALTHSGNNQEVLSVTYSAADGIDPNSLQDGNLNVTRTGYDPSNTLPTYYLDQTTNSDGSITVRYQVQKDYAGHRFDALDNGSYTVSMSDGAVFDYNGTSISADLGTFDIKIGQPPGGIRAPVAILNPSDITLLNTTDAAISVTFSSNLGLDANSLGGGVTVSGPNGFSEYAYYQDRKVNSDGSITATFTLQHDGTHQAFTSADNGTYSVAMDDGAVLDLDGNSLVGSAIGTFKVNVPAVPTGLTAATAKLSASDLTDANATGETLKVTYAGPAAIAANTLDDYDLTITDPNGNTHVATFVSSTVNPDGSTTATYSMSVFDGYLEPLAGVPTTPAPGPIGTITTGTPSADAKGTAARGTAAKPILKSVNNAVIIGKDPIAWGGGTPNGMYAVALAANEVNDIRGVPVTAGTLGSFTVNLPPRQYPPPGPVYLDSATPGSGSRVSTDAHHAASSAALSNAPLGGASAANMPVRAHALAGHKKHHHKHKKHKAG